MKKIHLKLLTIFIGSLIFTIGIFANETSYKHVFNQIEVLIDNSKVDIETILYNNTLYVPIRKFSELFNKTVQYNNTDKTVNIIDEYNNTDLENLKSAFVIENIDDNIELTYQIRNISNKDINIKYDSILYDYIIYDDNNKQIYIDSLNNNYITAIVELTIRAKDNKTIKKIINIKDIKGITMGTYKIKFFFQFIYDSEDYVYEEEAFFNVSN